MAANIKEKDWREPSETELAWLTGIWEGEGSWTYYGPRKRKKDGPDGGFRYEKPFMRMQMNMTDGDIMERVGAIMDGRKTSKYDGGPAHKKLGQKPVYHIHVQGKAAHRWTNLMKPYLGKRRLEKYEFIMEKLNESKVP